MINGYQNITAPALSVRLSVLYELSNGPLTQGELYTAISQKRNVARGSVKTLTYYLQRQGKLDYTNGTARATTPQTADRR